MLVLLQDYIQNSLWCFNGALIGLLQAFYSCQEKVCHLVWAEKLSESLEEHNQSTWCRWPSWTPTLPLAQLISRIQTRTSLAFFSLFKNELPPTISRPFNLTNASQELNCSGVWCIQPSTFSWAACMGSCKQIPLGVLFSHCFKPNTPVDIV